MICCCSAPFFFSESMKQIIDRYDSHSKTLQKSEAPSQLQSHVDDSTCARLREELAESSLKLRQMRGEELQRLSIQQLQELEKTLESGLGSVLKTKSQKILDEINCLERKASTTLQNSCFGFLPSDNFTCVVKQRMQLIEENSRLKEQVTRMARIERQLGADSEVVYDEGQSSESVTNASYPRPPADTDDGGSDTSLRLGLPLFNSK
nr:unnamed protein product [Digitaria exilis]